MASLFLNALEIELIRNLNRLGAKYIVVGGHAVQFHGHLRPAKDLDLFVEPTQDNADRIGNAFSRLSLPVQLPAEVVQRLSKPNAQVRVNRYYHTELVTTVAGIEFETAMASAVVAAEGDVSVTVVSYEHLIVAKRALGRPQDLQDIEALELARASG
jgi:hypothetical protein